MSGLMIGRPILKCEELIKVVEIMIPITKVRFVTSFRLLLRFILSSNEYETVYNVPIDHVLFNVY